MKGIIFNLLEEVVCEHHGDAVWDDLLEAAESDGIYTSLGSYPDAQLVALVEAASQLTGTPVRSLLHWFGVQALPKLAQRYPKFFDDAPDARSLILSVNTIIHPEVRKLYSGASCPHFHFVEAPGTLSLGYTSPRKLCDLAHGFVEGVAAHYNETITLEQPSCMHDGAAVCQLVATWH
ncbi:heme NO-binding domain-containing protein [Novosphingobium ginsenosidimutans]|uniref:Heme NO-binding protein n=1 Tax=Novosphingobium ginsenosidimutans TaxID=1176536 RepID=A0A5B8S4V8_9SPHN|nr:heme NO-binding domain-containing protein [Novosphingobium ginsenosidimutans]QEA16214.1 heme NO-binding protein [Novosphingobium ginsenosidimutans]